MTICNFVGVIKQVSSQRVPKEHQSHNELMCLTAHQRQVLTQTARDCSEPDLRVRLFESRTDDTRKGGDIDLLIETRLQDPGQIARAYSQFLARVHLALGEQKIDVLIDYPDRQSQGPHLHGGQARVVVVSGQAG